MNLLEQLEALDLSKKLDATPIDGEHHRLDYAHVEIIKAQVHKSVDYLFGQIEYSDKDGLALNQIEVDTVKDFEHLPLPSGRIAHLLKGSSLKLKIGPTAMEFHRQMVRALDADAPMSAPTPAEQLTEDFRAKWRSLARSMYEAYGNSVNWKAVSGAPMPAFEELGARVEGAWCVVAMTRGGEE